MAPTCSTRARTRVGGVLTGPSGASLVRTFCGSLRFKANNLHNVVNINDGHVGVCAMNTTARNLSGCLGGGFGSLSRVSIIMNRSYHGGDHLFTRVSTGVFSTGNVGMCLFRSVHPAPRVSFTVHRFNYRDNVGVATSRGPERCGNCGTC